MKFAYPTLSLAFSLVLSLLDFSTVRCADAQDQLDQPKDFSTAADLLNAADRALERKNVIQGQYLFETDEAGKTEKHEGEFEITRPTQQSLAKFNIVQRPLGGESSFLVSDGKVVLAGVFEQTELTKASMFQSGNKLIGERWKGGPTSLLGEKPFGKLVNYGAKLVGSATIGETECWQVEVKSPTTKWVYSFSKSDLLLRKLDVISLEANGAAESTIIDYSPQNLGKLLESQLGGRNTEAYSASAKLKPGVDLAGVVFRSMEDKQVSITDFKGKVVVIDFWASWCAPCLTSIPEVEKLAQTYSDDQVVFLLVAWNDTQEQSIAIATREGYQLPVLSISAEESEKFDLQSLGIPAVFVLDDQGRLVDYQFGSNGRPGKNELKRVIDEAILNPQR